MNPSRSGSKNALYQGIPWRTGPDCRRRSSPYAVAAQPALVEDHEPAVAAAVLVRLAHLPRVVLDHVRQAAAVQPPVPAEAHALVRRLVVLLVEEPAVEQSTGHRRCPLGAP